jgi:cobalt-precorrin 5A hydrolase
MIVAGVGFRRSATADDIERIVRRALDKHGLERVEAIATESGKAAAPAFADAAHRLAVRTVACTLADLGGISHRVLTPSRVVQQKTGVPSIAEASALLAAGANARLLGARLADATVTCAIATGDGR